MMWNSFKGSLVGLVVVLVLSSAAAAQTTKPQENHGTGKAVREKNPLDLCALPGANTDDCVYDELAADPKLRDPAPVRDLTGVWVAHTNSAGPKWPPLTSLGKQLMAPNKPQRKFSIAETNDPFDRCDPLGMPRVTMQQTRGLMFAKMPDRVLILRQYDQVWREVFTDGRPLPKGVGGDATDAPDPRWYGYSVGHWEDDHTFVVNTTGSDDRSWIDWDGYPHSVDMQIEERYTRVNHDTLDITITMTDPKLYTKPIVAEHHYQWIPSQELEQQICVSSEAQAYHDLIADPAGTGEPSK